MKEWYFLAEDCVNHIIIFILTCVLIKVSSSIIQILRPMISLATEKFNQAFFLCDMKPCVAMHLAISTFLIPNILTAGHVGKL